MSTSTLEPGAKQRRTVILAVLGACFLVVMMDNTILNVALQTIQQDLAATNSELQWSVDSYILVYAALMFSAGVLADRRGRRLILLVGLAVFAVASALSAFAGSPEELIGWRAVMGLGGAVVPPATLAIIKDVFPADEHGKAMGVWAALGGMSVAFGPIIGGVLLDQFWWGSVFLINVPVVLVCAALILRTVPESYGERGRRLDAGGVILSVLGTAILVFGVIRGGETNEWLSLDAIGAIVAGLLLIAALVAHERRQADPALDISLFRSAPFTAGTLSISVAFFALTGGTFLLVFYVQLVRDHSPLELGLVLLPVAIGSVAAAVSSARIAGKRGARAVIVTGLLLLLASLAALYLIQADTPLVALELALLAAGLGMGLVMATTTTLAMSAVPAAKSGVGAGVNNTLRQIGAALGVAVMGSVYSVTYRNEAEEVLTPLTPPLTEEAGGSLSSTLLALEGGIPGAGPEVVARAQDAFVASMHTTVLVAVGVLALGALVAWRRLPAKESAPEAPHAPIEPVQSLPSGIPTGGTRR